MMRAYRTQLDGAALHTSASLREKQA